MCDRCGDPSQYRLMLCANCFRLLPGHLMRAWLAASHSSTKLAIAADVFEWASGQRSAISFQPEGRQHSLTAEC